MTFAAFGQNGNHFTMRIDGHAEYGPHGSDIVCAAASALAYTMVRWMEDHSDYIRAADIYEYMNGYVSLNFDTRPDRAADVRIAMGVIEGGFRLLADRYPEHVAVREGAGGL